MKIAITGWGRSGSWKIRAEQLGAAIGAKVEWRGTNFSGIDLIVYVKRINPELLESIRASGKPWVWDIVDAWPKPAETRWDRQHAVTWLRGEIRSAKPSAIITATKMMLDDSGWTGKSLVLPHHAWPRYKPHELRPEVKYVGYEGQEIYLGPWQQMVDEECQKRGWKFYNGDLTDADIGIALRREGSYPNKFWKSNCKLANLQALGIPAVCTFEEGYREFGSGQEIFVENREQLSKAFDRLGSLEERAWLRKAMLDVTPTLSRVAKDYKEWLTQNF